MNNVARQRLGEILRQYGASLAEDPKRVEAFLRDLCGEHKGEISVLVNALRENVVSELKNTNTGVPINLQINKLSKKLQDNLFINEEAATWAVESWALGLGVISTPKPEVFSQSTSSGQSQKLDNSFSRNITTTVSPTSDVILTVCSKGTGQYRTIGEALNTVRDPNTKIYVRPGIYNESIRLTKQVEIMGEGKRENIIIKSTEKDCILMNTDYALVKGLSLQGLAGPNGDNYYAVDIIRGRLHLKDCIITSNTNITIAVHGENSKPTIENCFIKEGKIGISFWDGASGEVKNCQIFENEVGIAINENSNPLIYNCQIYDGDTGIAIFKDGLGIIEECEIYNQKVVAIGIVFNSIDNNTEENEDNQVVDYSYEDEDDEDDFEDDEDDFEDDEDYEDDEDDFEDDEDYEDDEDDFEDDEDYYYDSSNF